MSQKDFQKWIKEVMLKVIENLGPNVDEARYELSGPTDILMSSLYNVSVKFKNKTNGKSEELSIILKRPSQVEAIRHITRTDSQFHNEILFYQMYGRPDENFPRCFYTDEKPPYDSVIVIENVSKQGYQPYQRAFNAPLECTLAAIREIARFHGKGYVMKERQREKFLDLVGQLQETRYNESVSNEFKFFLNLIAPRAIDYLRNRGYDAAFCDKTEKLLSNAFDEIMMKVVEPLESLSTLCHGDFTLGNILFKAEDGGRYHAMLIDFALLRYGRPVIDLSTYLCLSCSNEVRRDKFSEIMQAYHGALKEYLSEAGIWDAEKYSYEALLDDYKRGALFGFVIASFYLPTLLGYFNNVPQELMNSDITESAKMCKESGGDEMSKILADMLLQLRDLDCLQLVLNTHDT